MKSFSGCTAEAAAIVLRALHGRQRQSWQLPAARRLLSTSFVLRRSEDVHQTPSFPIVLLFSFRCAVSPRTKGRSHLLFKVCFPTHWAETTVESSGEDTEVPEWLLQHAVLWWPELQQVPGGSKKLQDFVEKVQKSYRASCSPRDLLAQKLLLSMEDTDDGQRPQRPWSFRSWAQNLKPWIASWEWDLDQRRLRATTDHFRFNRLAEGDASPYSDAWNQTLDGLGYRF